MDSTDPNIEFDEIGICNHCYDHDRMLKQEVISGDAGRKYLDQLVQKIKREGDGKSYDCIVGVSGGVDSTYVAYFAKGLGLRTLAVHVDNGWDSELAVKNIEEVVKRLDIDLYTNVLDWEEFKDLQVAFLKASTPDSEVPTDHAIWATLALVAQKMKVKYVLSGMNVRTETHLPKAWSNGHFDWKYIQSVHKIFGSKHLKKFPHVNLFSFYRFLLTQKQVYILNYIDYDKGKAMEILERELRWRNYGGKHHESIYTRFFQGFILPEKFGYDKRRSHLSSMICSGEITRAAALKEMDKPAYAPSLQEDDLDYVTKKLGLSHDQFQEIMDLPRKSYENYPSYGRFFGSQYFRRIYGIMRDTFRHLRSQQHKISV